MKYLLPLNICIFVILLSSCLYKDELKECELLINKWTTLFNHKSYNDMEQLFAYSREKELKEICIKLSNSYGNIINLKLNNYNIYKTPWLGNIKFSQEFIIGEFNYEVLFYNKKINIDFYLNKYLSSSIDSYFKIVRIKANPL